MKKLRIIDYMTLPGFYVIEVRNLSSFFMWLPLFFGKAEDINEFMETSGEKEVIEARAKRDAI